VLAALSMTETAGGTGSSVERHMIVDPGGRNSSEGCAAVSVPPGSTLTQKDVCGGVRDRAGGGPIKHSIDVPAKETREEWLARHAAEEAWRCGDNTEHGPEVAPRRTRTRGRRLV